MTKSTGHSAKRSYLIASVITVLGIGTYAAWAAISIPNGTAVTENFNLMGSSATATLPADFRVDRTTTAVRTVGTFAAAGTTTTAAGGTSLATNAANGIYNFGSTADANDRAIGFLASGTNTASGNLYAQLVNNTGGSLSGLTISYNVEKYRNGMNAAGFRIQMFYSTDGNSWTNAGADFLTSFPADLNNNGFATAPGATVSVSNQTLIATISNGSNFYLAWNYSVSTGTTVTNAQALAIDDISVTGIASGGDTAPSVFSTTPANSLTNVAVDSTISINFNESVSATASAFSLECPVGTPKTFIQSASPATTITLTPSDLPAGTTCTVKVTATEVTDTDTIDPPDNMASDYTFSFATAAPDVAPMVTTTTPANLATNVSVNSNVVVNFSESVNAQSGAFTIQCAAGPALTLTPTTSSPSASFTLTPSAALPYSTNCTVTVVANLISDVDGQPDNMTADYTFTFTTEGQPVGLNVIINEIDADTPGSDTAEFIELYDGGVGNTPLDGLTVVLFAGETHTSYAAFSLNGYSTHANGYFVLGNPGVPLVDLIFNPGEFGLLQNGADAVALYRNGGSFPNGSAITTTNLQDAIVYGTDDPTDSQLLVLLNAGQPQVNENAGGSGTTQSDARCANGGGGARNSASYLQVAPTSGSANVCPPPRPPSQIVISQLYGGGGNSGATFRNDYVELYNRGATTVFIDGWSLQYASATGSGWDTSKQPLGGYIGPGEYLLIGLASGGATGAPLPAANITGQINMGAAAGKVALVNNYDGLAGNCPIFNTHVMDLVGWGTTADCREGNLPSQNAPAPSNTLALFRLNGGAVDTDINHNDFVTGSPNPRRTAPIVELGPAVFTTDPTSNDTNVPRDATIQVIFTEPVDVVGAWFNISCASSGQHNFATSAVSGGGQSQYITPNINFVAGETCTVTLFKNQVHDVDTDDSAPNTDTLVADYIWSFSVATGTAPPYPPSVHLTTGNPSAAVTDINTPNNYLMQKPEFALSYNRDHGRPNWVSWHLSDEWIGTLTRVDTFRPDPQVPPDWYRVQSFDFSGSGFDRGHMTPNADRDKETSSPINQATFLMTNMLAQAPGNNQGPWAALENFLRTLVTGEGDEIYIVSGPAGIGGTGSNQPPAVTNTVANGHVTVPSSTWKVALVLPKGDNDISRVSCSSRTIAVIMPNLDSIRPNPWENYLTTVDAVEVLTGYNLFSNVPQQYQACIEAGINGNNPPLDTTAPTISCAPPDGAWHAANVGLACTASDNLGGSGLANPADDTSFTLFTSVSAGVEDANASTSSRLVCDVAGNCSAGLVSGNKIDRKGPVITLTMPANGAVYQLNQVVNAAYSCVDSGSGISACAGTAANLSPIHTATLGTKTFVVNSTDAVGNASSTTVTYDVKRTLSAVDTAKIWIGLSNSDAVGLRLDLRTELLVNGVVSATGDLNNIATGSSGFNNAILNSVPLALSSGPVDVPAGAQLQVRVSVRRTCFGNGHNSGTARQWFNGQPIDSGPTRDAGSRIKLTLAGTTSDYFLRTSFALSATAGTARTSVDAAVNSSAACPARPYLPFGVWSMNLP